MVSTAPIRALATSPVVRSAVGSRFRAVSTDCVGGRGSVTYGRIGICQFCHTWRTWFPSRPLGELVAASGLSLRLRLHLVAGRDRDLDAPVLLPVGVVVVRRDRLSLAAA